MDRYVTVEGALRGAAPHLLLDSLRTSLTRLYAASSADLLLIDYGFTSLRPVVPVQAPAGAPHVPVDAGPAGRVFRTQQPYLSRDVGPTATVYLPVTVRGDRFGVLVVILPSDRGTPETVESLGRVAETLGHALCVADRHTDLYRSTRRTHALSVAGEMQWDTLPGRACAGPAVRPPRALGACLHLGRTPPGLERDRGRTPADRRRRHRARYSRRPGEHLRPDGDPQRPAGRTRPGGAGQPHRPGALRAVPGKSPLAALLLRLDLATGGIEVVDAGSPSLWLIRDAVPERVELDRQLPLGMFEDTVYAPQHLRLLPGDRLIFVACGTGHPASTGEYEAPEGPVARALARTSHLSCADAPGAVVRALCETPRGASDAVLVLCLDWNGRGAAPPDPRPGGEPAAPPP